MKFLRRKLWKIAAFCALLLVLAGFAVLWSLSSGLVSPARREIQNYHREILAHPEAHGMRVFSESALDGEVPVLLVEPRKTPSAKGKTLRDQLRKNGVTLPPKGSTRATLVLLHGRHGCKEDLLPLAERYSAAGFRCLIPDLPAHGKSPRRHTFYGSTEFEQNLPRRVLSELAKKHHFKPAPAFLWGLSMGGSFAIHAASVPDSPFQKMVVISTFDTLQGVMDDHARAAVGLFLGKPLASAVADLAKMRSGIDTAAIRPQDRVKNISCPALVLHGDADELISEKRGRSLFRHLGSAEKKFVTVTGGNHHNVLITKQPVHAAICRFLLEDSAGS